MDAFLLSSRVLGSSKSPLVFFIYQNPRHEEQEKCLNTKLTAEQIAYIWSPYNPVVIVSMVVQKVTVLGESYL